MILRYSLLVGLILIAHSSFPQFEVEIFSNTPSPATGLVEVHVLYSDPSVKVPSNSDFQVSNAEIVRLYHDTETPEFYSQTYFKNYVYDFSIDANESISSYISTGYEKRLLRFYDGELLKELGIEDCWKCNEFEIFEDTIYIISAERGEIRKYDYDGNTLDTLSIKRTSTSLGSRRTKIQNNQIYYLTGNSLLIYNLSGSLTKVIGDTISTTPEVEFTDLQIIDNIVYIADKKNDRIVSYSLDGSHLGTIEIENLSPISFEIVDQRLYYLAFERLDGEYIKQGMYVSDLEGENLNKLFIPDSDQPFMLHIVGGKEGGIFAQIEFGRIVDYRISNKSKSTIYLKPLEDGVITIGLPKGALNNIDGVPNDASNTFTIVSDISNPIAILEFNENFDAEISFFLSFSESVTLFGDIYDAFNLSGASITKIDTLDGNEKFEVFLNPTFESGTIGVSFKDNRVRDFANNRNPQSDEIVIPYFPKDIVVTLDADTTDFQMKDTVEIQISFSEVLLPLQIEDIEIYGGYVLESSFFAINDSSYQMSVITPAESEIFIGMEANRLFNTIGIGNKSLPFHFFLKDRTRPEVELVLDEGDDVDLERDLYSVTVLIDDPVFDVFLDPLYCLVFPSDCFDAEDISVSGGYISDFTKVADGLYKCNFVSNQGYLKISIAENLMFNTTGLGNMESNTFQIGKPVLNIEENSMNFSLARNVLTVSMPEEPVKSSIKLIDLKGNVIREIVSSRRKNELDISALVDGVYILTVQYNKEIFITRIKK